MNQIYYYLLLGVFLYFLFTRILDYFSLEQENFDPSLVPVSSIVTLAKVAQKLVDGNGTLTNPGNLQIGASTATPGNLTVTGNNTVNGTSTVDGTSNITGNTTIGGALAVNGNTTLSGPTSLSGLLNANSGATLSSATVTGTLSAGATTLSSATVTGTLNAGATTLSSANVTGTLDAGATTLSSATISGKLTTTGSLNASGGDAFGFSGSGQGQTLTGSIVTGTLGIGRGWQGSDIIASNNNNRDLIITANKGVSILGCDFNAGNNLNVGGRVIRYYTNNVGPNERDLEELKGDNLVKNGITDIHKCLTYCMARWPTRLGNVSMMKDNSLCYCKSEMQTNFNGNDGWDMYNVM